VRPVERIHSRPPRWHDRARLVITERGRAPKGTLTRGTADRRRKCADDLGHESVPIALYIIVDGIS